LASSDLIEQAAELLATSHRAVALTGAGISVPSGIPDFRSPGSGLWERADPMVVASNWGFAADPARFFQWLQPLAEVMRQARPNPAHVAMANLQAQGRLGPIITQNIDGLHEAAGSEDVLPVHGHTRSATCQGCGRVFPGKVALDAASQGVVPRCDQCGGVLKPDVILFGDLLPPAIYQRALGAAQRADLMLVAGSSLEVAPVSEMPLHTLARGGKLLIVNLGPTMLDEAATLKLEGDVAEVLPAIAAAVRGKS
jgi:NAD-dependent deacetylase